MSSDDRTVEQQYQIMLRYRESQGLESFGLMSSQAWHDDPKRLTFTLSRYKFVAKILTGSENVLEVGCADGFATRIVAQEVKRLTAVDFDPLFIEDAKTRISDRWKYECHVHDMLSGPVPGAYDGIYALDVLEHIQPVDESLFLRNMVASITQHGTMVLGMPSLESQPYASLISREGHVNCKSAPDFKKIMQRHFHNVYMFSMNDEVVHTGYHKMAHYLFAVCCGRRD
jgi:2-polyprenyl-3-methyl-5-hydroxy-6-metoxy-1,4-benzoquinol methylase